MSQNEILLLLAEHSLLMDLKYQAKLHGNRAAEMSYQTRLNIVNAIIAQA